MSPSTPNRLCSNEVSGPEADHRHIDRTAGVRSRLTDTLLIAVNEQPCSNSNPGRSAALNRGRAVYGGGHEVAGRITIEIADDHPVARRGLRMIVSEAFIWRLSPLTINSPGSQAVSRTCFTSSRRAVLTGPSPGSWDCRRPQ